MPGRPGNAVYTIPYGRLQVVFAAFQFVPTLGFVEVLAVMILFVWLAHRYYRKHSAAPAEKRTPALA